MGIAPPVELQTVGIRECLHGRVILVADLLNSCRRVAGHAISFCSEEEVGVGFPRAVAHCSERVEIARANIFPRDFHVKIDNDAELSFLGVLFHSFHTMSHNLLAEKLKQRRPDIYIRPEIEDVRVLEFYKAEQIFRQARPAQRQLLKILRKTV